MISTRNQPPRHKHRTMNRVLCTTLFTLMELWALVLVLSEIRASGAAAIALAVTLAAAVLAVIDAWRGVREVAGEEQ